MMPFDQHIGEEGDVEPELSTHSLSCKKRPTSARRASLSGPYCSPRFRAWMNAARTKLFMKEVRRLIKSKGSERTVNDALDADCGSDNTFFSFMLVGNRRNAVQ